MPIRQLESYIDDKKLYKSASLSALKDTRLGIDLQFYLSKLFNDPNTKEPLVAAMGGHPLALISHIESDLRLLDRWHIKPVFIFNGLTPNRKLKSVNNNDSSSINRSNAWNAYENGRFDDAIQAFGQKSNLVQTDLLRLIHKLFRQRHVEFLVAPYVSWPQLVYLANHPKSYIHSIFGSSEHLLYNQVDKVITSIDLKNGTFDWISKKLILNDLKINEDQFFDSCLLSGFELCPTFPPYFNQNLDFTKIVEQLKQFKNSWALIQNFLQNNNNINNNNNNGNGHSNYELNSYIDCYQKCVTLIRFSLILAAEEGKILPLPLALPSLFNNQQQPSISSADVPSDLGDIFSPRLPDEVYFHLCRGLINSWAINTLSQGGFQELSPLCNGESLDYKNFIKDYITESNIGPRAITIALIANALHPFWRNRQVHAHYYFHNHSTLVPHNSSTTTDLIKCVDKWNVPAYIIEDELRRQNSSTIDFALCLGSTNNEQLGSKTITKRSKENQILIKKDEIVANTIWRFLELRNFINSNHTHTPFGRAMHNSLTVSRLNDKFQEPLLILVELLRAKVLHDNYYSGKQFSGGPTLGTDDEKRCMLLVIRTISIIPMQFKPQPWSGPLSKELLAFNSFMKSLSRSLRSLVESITMNMLLKNSAKRARDDYLDIALSLPFQNDTNTGFGIFFKIYLDALTTFAEGNVTDDENDRERINEAKQSAREVLGESMPNVKDPNNELLRGFRFWDSVLVCVRTLKADKAIDLNLAESFEAANKWLHKMRPT